MVASKYIRKVLLEEVFEYVDGVLWRKERTDSRGQVYPKKLVTNRKNVRCGYCLVRFKTRKLSYHTIVWTLVKGDIPDNSIIDHIDGNKLNNSIENLRLVTHRQNSQNKRIHRNGKLVGCYLDKRRNIWYSETRVNGKKIFLGGYKTQEEAHSAYQKHLKEQVDDVFT